MTRRRHRRSKRYARVDRILADMPSLTAAETRVVLDVLRFRLELVDLTSGDIT